MILLFGVFSTAIVAAQLAKQGMVYMSAMLVLMATIALGLTINRLETTSP